MLSAHLTLEASWVEGTGLRVGVPGAPRPHPESWGRSPMGPQSLAPWMQVGGREPKIWPLSPGRPEL